MKITVFDYLIVTFYAFVIICILIAAAIPRPILYTYEVIRSKVTRTPMREKKKSEPIF